jgi:hypothetical protein
MPGRSLGSRRLLLRVGVFATSMPRHAPRADAKILSRSGRESRHNSMHVARIRRPHSFAARQRSRSLTAVCCSLMGYLESQKITQQYQRITWCRCRQVSGSAESTAFVGFLARDPPHELRPVDQSGGEFRGRERQRLPIHNDARNAGDVRLGQLLAAAVSRASVARLDTVCRMPIEDAVRRGSSQTQ